MTQKCRLFITAGMLVEKKYLEKYLRNVNIFIKISYYTYGMSIFWQFT
jgi:hypothetical protein